MARKPKIRVAVLECGEPMSEMICFYDGWTGLFEKHLSKAFNEFDVVPELAVSKYDVKDEMRYPRLAQIDAVMIPGSGADPTSEEMWVRKLVKFVASVLETRNDRIRVTGFCFGHQIIARALGYGLVSVKGGIQSGISKAFLTGYAQNLLETDQDALLVPALHKYAVSSKGLSDKQSRVKILAWNEKGYVEGLSIPGKALTMQGHPEFDCCMLTNVILSASKNKLISGDQAWEDLEMLTASKKVSQTMSNGLVWQAVARLLVNNSVLADN